MPKKKQHQRRAKGVTVASSTSAFNTLKNEGISNQGFIGFGAFANDNNNDYSDDNNNSSNNNDTAIAKQQQNSPAVRKNKNKSSNNNVKTSLTPFYQGDNSKLKIIKINCG